MAPRTYQNFDLLIESTAAGYRARVVNSPTGESPSVDFTLPFDPTLLENLLLKLDPGRSGTRRVAQDPQVQAGRDFGGPLFDAVFAGDVAMAWSRGQDATRGVGHGVRLRLRLTDAPALAGLPWELLYDRRGNAFLAQHERTPLVRYLDIPQAIRPLGVNGALRILVVVSSPTDLPELDGDAEFARVRDVLGDRIESGQVVVDRLPGATVGDLAQWLRTHDTHVLHFVGHGDFDARQEDGVLYFCDAYGRSSAVTSSVLGPFVHDHDPLRLVVLNACRSAHVDQTDPYSGMAQGLVQQDAAAVVAMQFPISDRAAVAFTGDFYGALADGLPVDQAVTSTRKTLNADFGAEWATPILFLRASDGQIFHGITPTVLLPRPRVSTPPGPGVSALPEASEEQEQPRTVPQHEVPEQPEEKPEAPEPPGPSRPPTPEPEPEPHQGRRGWVAGGVAGLLVVAGALWFALPHGTDRLPPDQVTTTSSSSSSSSTSSTTSSTTSSRTGSRQWAPGATAEAARFASPPTIDGNVGDWSGHTAYESNWLVAMGPSAVKATWRLGWDASNYYVLATVKDPQITQTHAGDPSLLWKGDSVSFELGVAPTTVSTTTLQPGDVHVIMGPTPDGSVVRAINVRSGGTFQKSRSPFTDGEVAAQVSPDGYTIEAAIPWQLLTAPAPKAGTVLATNLNVSDATPAGELQAMRSNNPHRTNNGAAGRYLWGKLTLVDG